MTSEELQNLGAPPASQGGEQPLEGGNVTPGVVRVGDTVRRPVRAHTAAVHALLRHLESVGFSGAPRVLGIDDEGREVLSFIAGASAWPLDRFAALRSDEGLLKVARLIRDYHLAAASFLPPPDAEWTGWGARGTSEIICHNDLAPWNLILEPAGKWAFVDWDCAAPGTRLSDLAYAARNFVPLHPGQQDTDIVRRLKLLCRAWNLEPDALMEAILCRAVNDVDEFRTRAAQGRQPWHRLWAEGHGSDPEYFTVRNAIRWLRKLTRPRPSAGTPT